MSESALGPCTACGQKPATAHVVTIVNGEKQVEDLCGDCFGKKQPALVTQHLEALMKATCIYCGAKAATGLNLGPWLKGEAERFACHECFQEHHAYFLKRLEALSGEGHEAPGEEGMNQIRAIQDEADAHMRRWISQKLN